MRGALSLELHVSGPKTELHDGQFGGAIPNPLQGLCKIVALLRDKRGRISIPGFYDRVLDVDEASGVTWPLMVLMTRRSSRTRAHITCGENVAIRFTNEQQSSLINNQWAQGWLRGARTESDHSHARSRKAQLSSGAGSGSGGG